MNAQHFFTLLFVWLRYLFSFFAEKSFAYLILLNVSLILLNVSLIL